MILFAISRLTNMLKVFKNKNSVVWVMGLLFVIKILGFLKLRTIAQIFGVSHELDIFWAAFTIPDMIFMVLVAGSINAAIIPIFSEVLYCEGKKDLNKIFNNLLIVLSILFIVLCGIIFIITPQITEFLINSEKLQTFFNFSRKINYEDLELFVYLTRLMLISPIILGISNLITAYLQVEKQFFVTSLAPLFYNLAMIVGPIIFVSVLGMGVEGIAISAIIGSFLHLISQLPSFLKHYGEKFELKSKCIQRAYKDKKVWKMIKLAFPRTIGILGEQINVVVNTVISFTLAAGALSAYKFAFSLHLFPVNIIGSAVAQVSLPEMAKFSGIKDSKKFEQILNSAVQLSLYLIFPIVAILVILRLPLVRLAYGTGAFDWRATILTAWCLALLGVSVIGQTVVQIFLRAFYAIKETRLPLLAILLGIIVNITSAYLLTNFFSHYYDWRPILEQIWIQISHANGDGLVPVISSFFQDTLKWMTTRGNSDMAVGGLALSVSISYFFEMIAISFLLHLKIKVVTWKKMIQPILMKLINTIFMGIGMYFVFKLFDFQLDTTRTLQVIILTVVTVGYGFISYLIGSKIFRIKEFETVQNSVDNFVKRFTKKNEKNI